MFAPYLRQLSFAASLAHKDQGKVWQESDQKQRKEHDQNKRENRSGDGPEAFAKGLRGHDEVDADRWRQQSDFQIDNHDDAEMHRIYAIGICDG